MQAFIEQKIKEMVMGIGVMVLLMVPIATAAGVVIGMTKDQVLIMNGVIVLASVGMSVLITIQIIADYYHSDRSAIAEA